jgi:hypothetical protein
MQFRGVVVIQHLDEQFVGGLADRPEIGRPCATREGRSTDEGRQAPGDQRISGSSHDTLSYSPVLRECSLRPSVDVFLEPSGIGMARRPAC